MVVHSFANPGMIARPDARWNTKSDEVQPDRRRGNRPSRYLGIAKRLQKEGIVERFNQKSGIFTLQRMSNNDCLYLDRKSRMCTIYETRPDTCRNHPRIGPRPGYCAYIPKAVERKNSSVKLMDF